MKYRIVAYIFLAAFIIGSLYLLNKREERRLEIISCQLGVLTGAHFHRNVCLYYIRAEGCKITQEEINTYLEEVCE